MTVSSMFNVWNEDKNLCKKPVCWETVLGQEFYMLTILDFLVQLALVFLVMVPRKLILGSGCCGGKEDWYLDNFAFVPNLQGLFFN